MNKAFAIGIPTINRYDLLRGALSRYAVDFPNTNIYIIDNGNQGIPDSENVSVLRPEKNIGVAASWNVLCDLIFKNHEYAVILNDDIVWGMSEKELISHIISLFTWFNHGFIKSEKEWSVFVLSKNTYTLVGQFDETFFPAYFEDNDYWYRMNIAGIKTYTSASFNPVVYRNSMTIHKDPGINSGFMSNRGYYIKKWGGTPGNEQYRTAFIP